ncbi:Hpt domain-containing protein [Herbaspirillum sp. RV1423]|uniref:hybrid sensor histidine kinase/response regulator n=1 Tax=Herbaspirillum sp. RV1423 TaxID=1443993 RepID=UPI0012DD8210|nr:Hpt domain-containing protein [Herbaspirillum sp. RV1423]
MTTDPIVEALPRSGPDPAALILLAPGLTEVVAEAARVLDSDNPSASQARETLLQGAKTLSFIGEMSLATLIAAMTDVFDAGHTDVEGRAEVQRACQAMLAYLDDIAESIAPHPLCLFSVYKNLLVLRGAERIHPSDLVLAYRRDVETLSFPDDDDTAAEDVFPGHAACRAAFERSLLSYFRATDTDASLLHLRDMQAVVDQIARAQDDGNVRIFWRALAAAVAALAYGEIVGDQYVKQFLGQINLQLRRLAGTTDSAVIIDAHLLRDALFFVSLAPVTDIGSARIKAANGLHDLRQKDYLDVRYGDVRGNLSTRAREQAVRVQGAWEKLLEAGGDAIQATSFEHELAHLNALCDELDVPALGELLSGMSHLAHDAIQAGPQIAVGLEMAKGLLFLEQCLRHIRDLPECFPDQVNAIIQRLTSALSGDVPIVDAGGIDAAMGAVFHRDAVGVAMEELTVDLARIEALLEGHADGSGASADLPEAANIAARLAAVAAMLQLGAVAALFKTCVADIRGLPCPGVPDQEARLLSRLSHNLAALSLSLPIMRRSRGLGMPYAGILADEAEGMGTAALPENSAADGEEQSVEASSQAIAPTAATIDADEEEDIDTELLDVFLAEALEVLTGIAVALASARQEPANMAHVTLLRQGFHTIKGSGRMVGLNALGKGAMALEDFLNAWQATGRPGNASDHALLEYAEHEIAAWVREIREHGKSRRRPDALIAAAERVAHGEAFSFSPEEIKSRLSQPAAETQAALSSPADAVCRIGDLELPARLHQIYSEESENLLDILAEEIAQWQQQLPAIISPEALRATHSLKSSSASVGFSALRELAQPLDDIMQFLENYPGLLDAPTCVGLLQAVHSLQSMQQEFAACRMPAPREDLQVQLRDLLADLEMRRRHDANGKHAAEANGDNVPVSVQADAMGDKLDPELLDIFLEEGRDLLPQIGESLHKLQKTPGDTSLIHYLLRPLHTIKGSARMAGAMRLGQHMHDLESRIDEIMRDGVPSAEMIDELLARYDQGLLLFDALQAGGATTSASSLAQPESAPAGEAPFAPEADPAKTASAAPLVRIRAGILDNLLNQAGEISISRSGLESEVGVLRDYLADLGDNVARLGTQLREIEIQAEIQITASNQRQPQHQHFDPLEFDRFTHLQELTRMLAESVNDVASLQKNLLDVVDHTQNGLVQQTRLTREMQRELMHARMVQFKGVEERLYRLVRQMAKETGKDLKLDIVGGAVELDRSILEKMVGPFEHLLRNAAAHGIETAEQRRAAGKDAVGHLLLEVKQEGNEAMIRLSDDGQGLNLGRIREKAILQGLIDPGRPLSDAELTGIIFHPGFSTSSNVTAIAGRGVGMDVVRSEVASLGGRISIDTVAGKGAQFIIHLPLSLAVAQVVLLELEEQTYAIPSLLVEQVLQLKGARQEQVFRDGVLDWQDRKLPVHYLSALLGDDRGVPLHYTLPVMVVKSGHDFLAILVDHIIGNREVVTKNIGPQLANMIGVVGATVLGDGSIVLILNPIQLAQRHGYQKILRHVAPQTTDDSAGKKVVLVVDDSLTVRRVMHRLLTREGYHVVLATDGVDALHQLQNMRPDIVLLDIEMPRMDGFDLARNIRDIDSTATLPIIMITSRTAAKHRERAMELGINEYLGKPYQDEVLLKMIHGLIENDGVRPEFCVDEVLFKPAGDHVDPAPLPPSEEED